MLSRKEALPLKDGRERKADRLICTLHVTNITTINQNITFNSLANRSAATIAPASAVAASRPIQRFGQRATLQQLAQARPVIGQEPLRPTLATAGVTPTVAASFAAGTGRDSGISTCSRTGTCHQSAANAIGWRITCGRRSRSQAMGRRASSRQALILGAFSTSLQGPIVRCTRATHGQRKACALAGYR